MSLRPRLLALSLGLIVALAVGPDPGFGNPKSTLTAGKCTQAKDNALQAYEMGRKNKSLYKTDEEAKAASRRIFMRQVMAEVGTDAPKYSGDEYNQAIEHCRRLQAPRIAEALGLIAETAMKGMPSKDPIPAPK